MRPAPLLPADPGAVVPGLTGGPRGFGPWRAACWASAGFNAAGCAAVENQLRRCMDGPPPAPAPANTINYHLSRMNRHVTGPRKQK